MQMTLPERLAPSFVVSVGLEEGPGGTTSVHALSLPGCIAWGPTRDEALAAFSDELPRWLTTLAAFGEPLPSPDQELEIAVDEWLTTGATGIGETTACFDADLVPLGEGDLTSGLHRLGDLRGVLLARIRRMKDADLEAASSGGWSAKQLVDELARAQWWTLTRLGSSPLGEVPGRALARLDTAMALIVQTYTEMGPEARARVIELEGEVWTARKALRRLLWIEWTLGRAVLSLLPPAV